MADVSGPFCRAAQHAPANDMVSCNLRPEDQAMRRREFITLLGGAVASPLAARAQQPALPVIGFMSGRSPEDSTHLVAAFRQGLAENGFVEGQTVAIEFRW